jgi:hypothetical protein
MGEAEPVVEKNAQRSIPRSRAAPLRATQQDRRSKVMPLDLGEKLENDDRAAELAHSSRHLGVLKALHDLPKMPILQHSGKKRVVGILSDL